MKIPFFSSFASQLQRKLSRSSGSLSVLHTDNNLENETRHIRTCSRELDSGQLSGLVFISSGANLGSYKTLTSLIEQAGGSENFPVVVVDREIPGSEHYRSNILCDNGVGIRLGVEHLAEYGHTKIGFLEGAESTDPAKIRKAAFIEECRNLELQTRDEWMFSGDFTFRAGREAAESIRQMSKHEWPSAIFCANDLSAAGLIQSLNQDKSLVPKFISVIGFDGSPLSGWLSPGLTTIAQPIEQMANHAAYALISEPTEVDGRKLDRVTWVTPLLKRRQSVEVFRK